MLFGFLQNFFGGIGCVQVGRHQKFAKPERFLDIFGHAVAKHDHRVAVLAVKRGFFGVHILENADRKRLGADLENAVSPLDKGGRGAAFDKGALP